MAKAPKRAKVFISYARTDARKVNLVVDRLKQAGILTAAHEIIREEDLASDHRAVRDEVKRQIQSASLVVVLWGEHSANSQWVNYELGLADAFSKRIIVVTEAGPRVPLPASVHNVQVVEVATGM